MTDWTPRRAGWRRRGWAYWVRAVLLAALLIGLVDLWLFLIVHYAQQSGLN